MSDTDGMGFGKFVPGFDFLQSLAKGASQTIPQIPNLANWVSPSLNVEELEKRIEELRAVHFWLEQNSRALGATIQALEVQKMTLAALKGMNFNLGDIANAFTLKAADSVASGVEKATENASETAKTLSGAASTVGGAARKMTGSKATAPAAATSMVDPLNLWGALTQQFQQIAASAMQEATRKSVGDATRNMSSGLAREAGKAGKKDAATRSRKSATGKSGGRGRKGTS
ncbi:MAG: PhaM family polyhydroxyalkanoate granule multifunctional regulatory protein [Betaproteobacteria bacterium]